MPELPEVLTYLETLAPRIVGEPLERVRVRSPSLLRTYDPPVSALEGLTVRSLRRMGKRIVWALDDDIFAVFHLMVTGRFKWRERGAAVPRKNAHAGFDFPTGTLLLTEAGTKKRASLHVVRGEAGLEPFERGGLDVRTATPGSFREVLLRENRTLKRALTDPRILDGIGNAHSDEILHRARLSPTQRTGNLTEGEIEALYRSAREELAEWIERRRDDAAGEVPDRVSAFHPAMAVHGRFREPCPRCGDPVQRIRYAANETNYCATCQTDGRVLKDRGLSRLLGDDWPRTLEELEELTDR
ncbi:MAG: DNA-formamidopyrimidine glycosylase family protein [Gemmatimonadota bacterium]